MESTHSIHQFFYYLGFRMLPLVILSASAHVRSRKFHYILGDEAPAKERNAGAAQSITTISNANTLKLSILHAI